MSASKAPLPSTPESETVETTFDDHWSMGPTPIEEEDEAEPETEDPSPGWEQFWASIVESNAESRIDTVTDEGRSESIAETLELLNYDGDWSQLLDRIPRVATDPEETEFDRFHAAVQLFLIYEEGPGPFPCPDVVHAVGEFRRFGLIAPKAERRYGRCAGDAPATSSEREETGR